MARNSRVHNRKIYSDELNFRRTFRMYRALHLTVLLRRAGSQSSGTCTAVIPPSSPFASCGGLVASRSACATSARYFSTREGGGLSRPHMSPAVAALVQNLQHSGEEGVALILDQLKQEQGRPLAVPRCVCLSLSLSPPPQKKQKGRKEGRNEGGGERERDFMLSIKVLVAFLFFPFLRLPSLCR